MCGLLSLDVFYEFGEKEKVAEGVKEKISISKHKQNSKGNVEHLHEHVRRLLLS